MPLNRSRVHEGVRRVTVVVSVLGALTVAVVQGWSLSRSAERWRQAILSVGEPAVLTGERALVVFPADSTIKEMSEAIDNAKGLPDNGYTLLWAPSCSESRKPNATAKSADSDWTLLLNAEQRVDGCDVVATTGKTPATLVHVPKKGVMTRESFLLAEQAGTFPSLIENYVQDARAAALFPPAQSPPGLRDLLASLLFAVLVGAAPWVVFLVGRWVIRGFVSNHGSA